ncbi:MAG: 30S ribosomal protein S18 [Kiritimatiellia bacterium]|nr:30S ribosomal protein S18 [Kiritimatiellia bacterium]
MAFKKNDKGAKRRPRRNDQSQKRAPAMQTNELVDINDIEFLRRFVTDFGKIVPARVSGVTAHQQRQIKKGVRRARNMGLLA